jgi:hypothetical protein
MLDTKWPDQTSHRLTLPGEITAATEQACKTLGYSDKFSLDSLLKSSTATWDL